MKINLSIALLALLIPTTYTVAQVNNGEQVKPSEEVTLLLNEAIGQRERAFKVIVQQRVHLVQDLIKVARDSTDVSYYGPKSLAIQALGEIRASQAVPVLSDSFLFLPKGRDIEGLMDTQQYYVCAQALSQVGSPAIPVMLYKIKNSESSKERHLAAWVILQIEGSEQAAFRLQRASTEITGQPQEHVKEAISYIRNFKPTNNHPEAD